MSFASYAVVPLAFLAIAELATAGNGPMLRQPTHIPQESLRQAIRTLAKQRGFQVVYVAGQLGNQRTRGASGDLTVDEALTQVLRGTGLTFYKVSDSGVLIEPIASRTAPEATHNPSPSATTQLVRQSSRRVSHAARTRLDRITIRATEDRQALRRKVQHFVTAALARRSDGTFDRDNESLVRWDVPICPLVAGLPSATGKLTLARISDVATFAHIRLARKVCYPNLYVVATHSPNRLLEKWWIREPRMYVTEFGIPPVERFIHSGRPIRVWYDIGILCAGFTPTGQRNLAEAVDISGPRGSNLPVCALPPPHGVRGPGLLELHEITAAIVVIDLGRIRNISMGQIADYVALAGLADVRLDAHPAPQPSILELFGHGAPPQGLTRWDRALLYSVYDTSRGPWQTQDIELDMATYLTR